MRKYWNLLSMTLAVTIVIWSVPAWSGIIVTVGKHSAEPEVQHDVDDCPYDGVAEGGAELPSVDDSLPVDTAPSAQTSVDDAAGMDDVPDTMHCQDIGGGIEYCESVGNGPGAAGGGGLDQGSETQEMESLGCQGAPQCSTLLWLGLGLLALLGLRRRRSGMLG